MTATAELLATLRDVVSQGRTPDARIRAALRELTDPAAIGRAGKVLAGLAPGTDLRPVRVALAATFTSSGFADSLRTGLVAAGALPAIAQAPYGRFELSLAAPHEAGIADADVLVCLLHDGHFLPDDWTLDLAEVEKQLRERVDQLEELVTAYAARFARPVVLHTVPLSSQVRNAVLSWRSRAALSQLWHQLNARLLGLAADHRQIAVVDLVGVLADLSGRSRDNRMHRYADMPYTPAALVSLADEVRRFIQTNAGLSRKALAFDLDNTLWGGVLGEDGPHGIAVAGLYPANCYHALQLTAARLREQGVVLTVASKNDADLVTETLRTHPDMVLRPDAFSATAVSWEPKASGLRAMADNLGLSTGAFVFVDDSAFEREHVAAELPDVAVVAADGDPADIVESLLRHGYFDAVDLTDTDRARPALYQARAERAAFSGAFSSSEEYLAALDVRLSAATATAFTVGRVAQLAARTNQFNLTGVRFDEATSAALLDDPTWLVASFQVADRWGDEGIVGAAWIRRDGPVWRVVNAVLSCRVLGRGIDLAMAAWIVDRARAAGATLVEGRFVASGRNGVASEFWTRAGFTAAGDGVFTLAPSAGACPSPAWISVMTHAQRSTEDS